MFEPLLGFTDPNCTGRTNTLFLHEKPQFVSAKGTTKKAEALELFVYPNLAFRAIFIIITDFLQQKMHPKMPVGAPSTKCYY